MKKPPDPRELAVAILERSICNVKVGAVLADKQGIFAWGWNHMGTSGYGVHAEAHCLSRANKARLRDAVMYVAGARSRNGKAVPAQPCPDCSKKVACVGKVVWRDSNNEWIESK